jgi:hypothetical protein
VAGLSASNSVRITSKSSPSDPAVTKMTRIRAGPARQLSAPMMPASQYHPRLGRTWRGSILGGGTMPLYAMAAMMADRVKISYDRKCR